MLLQQNYFASAKKITECLLLLAVMLVISVGFLFCERAVILLGMSYASPSQWELDTAGPDIADELRIAFTDLAKMDPRRVSKLLAVGVQHRPPRLGVGLCDMTDHLTKGVSVAAGAPAVADVEHRPRVDLVDDLRDIRVEGRLGNVGWMSPRIQNRRNQGGV